MLGTGQLRGGVVVGAAQKGKVSLPRLFIIIIRILVKDGRKTKARSSTLGETHARLVCSPPRDHPFGRDWEWWEHVAFWRQQTWV